MIPFYNHQTLPANLGSTLNNSKESSDSQEKNKLQIVCYFME